MTITFLGANAWFDTETGNTPSILIDSEKAYIVLDAGNGIYKLDRYIKDTEKPIYLFISHLHMDHISGLHLLNKFHFPQGMSLVVPEVFAPALTIVFQPPYMAPPDKLNLKVTVVPIHEGENSVPLAFSAFKMFHSSMDFGYRFTLENKVIAYSGDTGICDNELPLAHEADVLIYECSNEPGHPQSPWGHMNPTEAATVAKNAGAKQLLLMHFAPNLYPNLESRKEAENVARAIFPYTKAMVDDDQIVL
ncbi:MAG: ribonuclease Z [Microgenomates group bacterium]